MSTSAHLHAASRCGGSPESSAVRFLESMALKARAMIVGKLIVTPRSGRFRVNAASKDHLRDRTVVGDLTDVQREAILATYTRGHSIDDTATLLSVSPTAVAVLVRAAGITRFGRPRSAIARDRMKRRRPDAPDAQGGAA